MYARCPHCETVFTIGAAALRAARGTVRCGHCLESFDALQTLEDAPGVAANQAHPGADLRVADAAPGAPDHADREPVFDPGPLPRPSPSLAAADPATEAERVDSAPVDSAVTAAAVPDGFAAASRQESTTVPEALREDLARAVSAARAARARGALTAVATMLSALLLLQFTWFDPGEVLRRYPGAHGWVSWWCARSGCTLPERRDPARISVLSRDVRVHPRYEGALRVRATLLNAAPFTQPYPRLRFTLFNVNGQVIASRAFSPPEYLGPGRSPDTGMRSSQPTEIALELLAPDEAAVSFEFAFL